MSNTSNETGPETMLTVYEVAERWGCHPVTVRKRKDLPTVRLSRRMIRYRLGDVLAFEGRNQEAKTVEPITA